MFYQRSGRPAPPVAYEMRRAIIANKSWAEIGKLLGGVSVQAARAKARKFGLVKDKTRPKNLNATQDENGLWTVGGKLRTPVPTAGIIDAVMLARAERYNLWCTRPAEKLPAAAKELGVPANELCRQMTKLRDDETYVPKRGTPRPNRARRKAANGG